MLFLRFTLVAIAATFSALPITSLRAQSPSSGDAVPSPARVIVVDLTGDGLPDRLHLGADSIRVERNLGAGRHEEVIQDLAAIRAHQVLVTDLDADGLLDVYFASPDADEVWLGLGAGRFREAGPELGLTDAGYGLSAERIDLDGDGIADLLLHNASGDVLFHARPVAGRLAWERDAGTPEIVASEGFASGSADLAAALLGGALDTTALPEGVEVELGTDESGRLSVRLIDVAPPQASAADSGAASAATLSPAPTTLGGGTGLSTGKVWSVLPSLEELIERFVDDDAGEVDAADVLDGSLKGADVSTTSGNVTHTGGSAGINVGIGTSAPQADLHVKGDLSSPSSPFVKATVMVSPATAMQGFESSELWLTESDEDKAFIFRHAGNADKFALYGTEDGGTNLVGPALCVERDSGRVGILTESPNASLGVKVIPGSLTIIRGLNEDDETVFRIFEDGRAGFGTDSPNAGLGVREVPSTTTLFRAMNAAGTTVTSITNTGRVVCNALQINGGGDLVEAFESSAGAIEPGTVVCIDPTNPGRVRPSTTACDATVIGAVSGANGVNHGIRMVQDGVLDGDTLVAITGRIYVRCSTESGPIRPGDRLTTSSLPGHAMRVAPDMAGDGAVLGKALSALEQGEGLVLVLVNLQ